MSRLLQKQIEQIYLPNQVTARNSNTLKANLKKRLDLSMNANVSILTNKLVLTRPPKFSISEVLENDKSMEVLAFAQDKLREAIQNLPSSSFYQSIFQATQLFVNEDFYIPVMESLNSQINLTNPPKPQAQKEKLSKAMNLLDAHVY